ncbi:hypothetical protein QTP81_09460 [Alteromonas sp. ASW11-36]|uniref:Integral membrane protein n=1 Tax=Alteromonas arenosi TaxID=3055817 RepID=A0ABT7SXC6_9ALTE|nr:hypothetical protein [Alteromonas sp. ASW11-36]MDM7860821.1 hypothetical protein [Alteromonas sp. ASW11-36]
MSDNPIENSAAVQRALAGKANIDVFAALKQANELTKGSFATFSFAGVVVLAIFIAVFVLGTQLLNIEINSAEDMATPEYSLLNLIIILVMSPLLAGLTMMGVNRARRKEVKVLDVFQWISIAVVIALGALIVAIIVEIGLQLFILPGLYLGIATTFTSALIVDKKLTAVSAIVLSVRVVNRYLGQFVLFFVVSLGLFAFAGFTLGVGLVWVLPLYFNTKGILYENLFGDADFSVEQTGSTFSA